MKADTIVMINNDCFLYLASNLKSAIPNLANMYAMTGSWKTTPITSVNDVNVETYEFKEITLVIQSWIL